MLVWRIHLFALLALSAWLAACTRGPVEIGFLPVASEEQRLTEDGALIHKVYFVVTGAPGTARALRPDINAVIAGLLAAETAPTAKLHAHFYRQGGVVNAGFVPLDQTNCLVACEEKLHIWDLGADSRLASVYVSRDACQIHRHYVFFERAGFFFRREHVVNAREIISAAACRERYGRIPGE